MRAKLGLPAGLADDVTSALVGDLVALMRDNHVDHTSFFRHLGAAARGEAARGEAAPARDQVLDLAAYDAWAERWLALAPDPAAMDRERKEWPTARMVLSTGPPASRRSKPSVAHRDRRAGALAPV
jgi:uncharacterized protein YdiU (UPF0061 family)